MGKAGESPVKRVKKIHRGQGSSAGQKKRDQKNEKYYLGAFAFAWFAQNYGTANCNVATTGDGGERSIEKERGSSEQLRQLLEAHRTAGKMLSE